MAELYYCKISSVNYESGTASVTIQSQENQVITGVPFLSMAYEMPGIGDTVAVIFEKPDGKIGKGVILGKIFTSGNRPKISGAGIFFKEFSDGASVRYDPSDKSMEIKVDKIVVDEVEYKKATLKG